MKLFNPFRAHLAQFPDGRYGVRRLTPIGWHFYDLKGTGYWWLLYWDSYCAGTEEQARSALKARCPSKSGRYVA